MLRDNELVVVVRSNSPVWLILMVLSIISLVIAGILILALGRGNGNLMIVAIPGFPAESIILGLTLGMLLIFVRRIRRTASTFSYHPFSKP